MVQPVECPSRCKGRHCYSPDGAGQYFEFKGIGEGVFECRIDFGPGYRIYFGKDGDALVIILGGGTKKSASRKISLTPKYFYFGKNTSDERDRSAENGTYKRF